METIIRPAAESDLNAIHQLIIELAEYEKEPNEVDTTVSTLAENAFGSNPLIHILVAENNAKIIGFALYYFAYSTWKGKSLYLEDFVVNAEYRRQGIGEKLFECVIEQAKSNNCQRMDWQVLDWNTPAINFYKKYDAKLESGWLNGRFYKSDLYT